MAFLNTMRQAPLGATATNLHTLPLLNAVQNWHAPCTMACSLHWAAGLPNLHTLPLLNATATMTDDRNNRIFQQSLAFDAVQNSLPTPE